MIGSFYGLFFPSFFLLQTFAMICWRASKGTGLVKGFFNPGLRQPSTSSVEAVAGSTGAGRKALGSVIKKVEPVPWPALAAEIVPPCASTEYFEIANPKPSPP